MATNLNELKRKIIAELKKVYSETFIEHSMNPRNLGVIPEADASSHVDGPCGDAMEIFLKVRTRRIAAASFLTNGCGTTLACGSMATELAKGRTLGEALRISAKEISDNLGGLPPESVHCAGLAESTLKKAIISYVSDGQNHPWKKMYARNA